MFKCKSRCLLKVISLIILQSFLFTSLSLAAPVEIFSLKSRENTLSPTIQVGQPLFLLGFQNASNPDVSFTQKLLGERFVVVDPLFVVGVEDVQIVETFSEAHAPVGQIESKVELMHAQNMAAVEVLKWLNDVGSKFGKWKADGAGTRWTRHYYNQGLRWMMGLIVIGEGERDEAPMLYIGEEVGGGWESDKIDEGIFEVDIAGDVVELTNGTNKKKILGTVSVATYSEKGKTLNASDIYMTKWVVGPQSKGCGISAKQSVEENINKIATKLNKDVSQLAGAMLLRERHVGWLVKFLDAGIQMNVQEDKELAALVNAYREFQWYKQLYLENSKGTASEADALGQLKTVKADLVKAYKALDKKVKAVGKYKIGNFYLLADGDLMPVWGMRMMGKGELDFVTGAGGSPEAVLTAGAVETLGGEMSARLCAYEVLKEAVKSDNPQDWPDVDEDWDKFTKEEESRLAGFGYDSAEKRGVVRSSNELIGGNDIVFIASAIKDSPWLENLKGVSFDEETGLLTVYVLRATKSGDKRIWKFRYKTGMPELREAISQESNP
ncbi:MAG: fructose-bisphosphatase class II, partial [Candidatus Omnitrophica bacterium]|nr:fructose-bisphosphatase class II [Candidatus Omnitrophota bacterium]